MTMRQVGDLIEMRYVTKDLVWKLLLEGFTLRVSSAEPTQLAVIKHVPEDQMGDTVAYILSFNASAEEEN